MTHPRRSGEPEYLSPITRTERVVVNDQGYFYRTRECDLIGPFVSKQDALSDLDIFIKVTAIEKEIKIENLLE